MVFSCTGGFVLLFFPHTPYELRFVVAAVALVGAVAILSDHHGRLRQWERTREHRARSDIDSEDAARGVSARPARAAERRREAA